MTNSQLLTADELCAVQPEGQQQAGYFHTLREILQQPATWLDTCDRLISHQPTLARRLDGIQSMVLSGSGSSQFAGECVRAVIQKELGIGVEAIDGGTLLTHGVEAISPGRPALMVSIARSGDSPESVGALSLLLDSDPGVRHLAITCNAQGELAQKRDDDRVSAVVLDSRTNDCSLVMTSSFTNLVLATRFLGLVSEPERYRSICRNLSEIGRDLLARHFGTLARVARSGFNRVVFLGSGPNLAAARESSLKMLEMTAGRVATMSQIYLGLRHGPMSFINDRTLVVCFLSTTPHLREYEFDLVRELNRKRLGAMKLIAGEHIPADLPAEGDQPIELAGLDRIGDDNAPVLHVVAGQLLAFFRCLAEGLKPDSPSETGVINRVVEEFPIHRRGTESTR